MTDKLQEYIKKVGSEYCIFSHKTDKKLSCYDTEAEAEKALKRMAQYREERGQGQGKGNSKQQDGGTGTCVCPKCGAEATHDRGTPCLEMKCPKCGTAMVGKSKEQQEAENAINIQVDTIQIRESKNPWTWKVCVIQEGLSKNRTEYTLEALHNMKDLVNEANKGSQPVPVMCYDYETSIDMLNHLSNAERDLFPEGFPKKTIGWLRNASIVEEGGINRLLADLEISKSAEWFKDLIVSAKEADPPIQNPFGLSIDGEGTSIEGMHEADGELKWTITSVRKLFEVTVVTYPSAGGEIIDVKEDRQRFVTLIESLFKGKEMKKLIEKLKELFENIKEGETLEDAIKALEVAKGEDKRFDFELTEENADEVLEKVKELAYNIKIERGLRDRASAEEVAQMGKMLEEIKAQIAELTPSKKSEPEEKPEEKKEGADMEDAQKILEELKQAKAELAVSKTLDDSKLSDKGKDVIRNRYKGVSEVDEKELREAILELEDALGTVEGKDQSVALTETEKEKQVEHYQEQMDTIYGVPDAEGRVKPFSSAKFRGLCDLYEQWTGDKGVTGNIRLENPYGRSRISEAIQVSDFSTMLGTSMTKHMVFEYDRIEDQWRKLCNVKPIRDFKQQDFIQFGAYAALATVNELGCYAEFSTPTEETGNYSPTKRGNFISISRESILNDDLGKFRRTTQQIGRAAKVTLNQFVFDLALNYSSSINGGTIYDSKALYHASHSNYATASLTKANLETAWVAMRAQTDLDSVAALDILPKYLIVSPTQRSTAVPIVESQYLPGGSNNDVNTAYKLCEVMISNYLRSDTNNWYLVADPAVHDTIELGFVQGREAPAVFVQNDGAVGMVFSHDKISYKIRHEYGGAVTSYQSFYGSVVT